LAVTVRTWNGTDWDTPVTGDTSAEVIQNTLNQSVVMLYITYVQGDESDLKLTLSFRDKCLENFFTYSVSESSTVRNEALTIQSTGTYRIPIPVAANEEEVKVTVELEGSPTTPGTVEVWCKPTFSDFVTVG